jgi:Catalytic LigB subunit of aromatic ring-opening dioxygenase
MSEILGLGITHQPTLAAKELRPVALRRALADPLLPEGWRTGDAWPARLREEFGDDGGLAACERHRRELIVEFARIRAELDAFQPDVVVIWGDDQYENFREDVVPPFCILAADDYTFNLPQPRDQPNAWDDPPGATLRLAGHRAAGKHLASSLITADFDVAYAYKPLHTPLGHAFGNTALYLDWDRHGFPYPIIPFTVNCYGRRIISDHGNAVPLTLTPPDADYFDPPGPSPKRCFALGAATARAFAASPWRVALVASSSWSHAFLTEKTYKLLPDLDSDRQMFAALKAGDFSSWCAKSLDDIEASGQQEMLNWFCLAGAMNELRRLPSHAVMVESTVANSNKVLAIYPPA